MKSGEYDETKRSGCLLRKNRKNKVAKLGLHSVRCPLLIGVELCKKVDRTDSYRDVNDEVKRIQWDK